MPTEKELSSPTLSTASLTEESSFAALSPEWDALVDASGQRACFLRCEWNETWWRHFALPECRLMLAACRDEHGTLVGLAPFYIIQSRDADADAARELRFLGTGLNVIGLADRDIIARKGYAPAVASAITDHLNRSSQWDRLWLNAFPASSKILPLFQRALGDAAEVSVRNPVAFIDARTDWESFLSGLSRATRKSVTRATRRLSASGEFQFRRVRTEAELEEGLSALFSLHRACWKLKDEPDTLERPHMEDFLRDIARTSLRKGRLRLWTLKRDGRVLAAELAFIDGGVVHHIQAGFDPSYARASIGTVLLGLCLKDSVEAADAREIVLGRSTGYKTHLAKQTRDTFRITLERDRPTNSL